MISDPIYWNRMNLVEKVHQLLYSPSDLSTSQRNQICDTNNKDGSPLTRSQMEDLLLASLDLELEASDKAREEL